MLDTLLLTRSQYDNSLGQRDTGTGRFQMECYVSNGK